MEYPWEVIKKAHAVGLLNTHIPEEYGGPGLGLMECSIISEELSYGCSGIQTAMEANGLAEAPLLVSASHETKQKYLGRMTEEPLVAAYCVVSKRGNLNEYGLGEDVVAKRKEMRKSKSLLAKGILFRCLGSLMFPIFLSLLSCFLSSKSSRLNQVPVPMSQTSLLVQRRKVTSTSSTEPRCGSQMVVMPIGTSFWQRLIQ